MALTRGKTTNDFKMAQAVAYVPHHVAKGLKIYEIEGLIMQKHPEIELGLVRGKNLHFVFVCFFPAVLLYKFGDITAQPCSPDDLYYGG